MSREEEAYHARTHASSKFRLMSRFYGGDTIGRTRTNDFTRPSDGLPERRPGPGISGNQLVGDLFADIEGAEYVSIADQLALHAKQELDHALIISRQIDYLGKMPIATPKPVKTSEKAKEMLRSDLANETETIRNYRERVQKCEQLGEYAMAEQVRQILVDEQDHQIDLATALGEEVPATEAPKVKRAGR